MKNNQPQNKLSVKWLGPYEIIKQHDKENVTIKTIKRNIRLHINQLKKYYETE
jgi:hypothetical protein